MVHQELKITEGIVGKENDQFQSEITQGQVSPYKKIPFNLDKTKFFFQQNILGYFVFSAGLEWVSISPEMGIRFFSNLVCKSESP